MAAELHIEKQVHFFGYVTEMDTLYPLCDAAVSTSKIEGLPFNILEAMSCGRPVLISDTKGHRDLVENKKEFLFQTEEELFEKIIAYALEPASHMDWECVLKKYELGAVQKSILYYIG